MSAFAGGREVVDFDFGWRFAVDAAPTAWREVDLPHDFQFDLPWDKAGSAARGYKPMASGTYRKDFFADLAWKGRRVALDFGGILCLSEVFLNGEKVAACDYGYLGFEVPLEGRLRYGATNRVEVKATTGRTESSRWYTGAGLYRGVRLVVREPVSVSRHGVFVKTRGISPEQATLDVEVEVDGFRRRTNDLEVAVRVLAPDGTLVGDAAGLARKLSNLSRTLVKLPPVTLKRPALWALESPALYTAEVTLRLDGRVVDGVRQRFGVRTAEFDPAYGFRLNGKKVFLQAMCNHHDLGAVGVAAYRRAIERQFRTMKAFGYNAIRCSHNPYSEDFYELADELGLLVVDELVDKWGQQYMMGRPLHESFFDRITEWVRRDRNHPSVILWSLGNETQHEEESFGFPADDWGVTTYRIFDVVVKRWDPTRKTTAAMYPAGANGVTIFQEKEDPESCATPPELCRATEVASINYRPDAYAGYVKRAPQLNIFQSEATVLDLLSPYWLMDRAHSVGLAYWGAIAYWGESGGWPKKGWNSSFFDHDLRPRPTAWQIRTAFRPDEPQVHVAVDGGREQVWWNDVLVGQYILSEDWNLKPGAKVDLTAYTNCEAVELKLNGRTLGVRRNDATTNLVERNIVRWKGVAWEGGRLEAIGFKGGRAVAHHALETTGPAVRLTITEETAGFKADGKDLKYLRLRAVDAAGRTVRGATAKVKVAVEGAAKLLALDDGDQATDGRFDVNEKALRDGELLVILRAGREAGPVKVTVTSENALPPATFLIYYTKP